MNAYICLCHNTHILPALSFIIYFCLSTQLFFRLYSSPWLHHLHLCRNGTFSSLHAIFIYNIACLLRLVNYYLDRYELHNYSEKVPTKRVLLRDVPDPRICEQDVQYTNGQTTAEVDCFVVHPTLTINSEHVSNAHSSLSAKGMKAYAVSQATAFNESCRIYMPYYR